MKLVGKDDASEKSENIEQNGFGKRWRVLVKDSGWLGPCSGCKSLKKHMFCAVCRRRAQSGPPTRMIKTGKNGKNATKHEKQLKHMKLNYKIAWELTGNSSN